MSDFLSKYFTGIGAKRLSEVEIDPDISNQHEFNGIAGFRSIFGTDKVVFDAFFIYMSENEEEIIEETGNLTWYDARENHPIRTEFRLYYTSTEVLNKANTGDLLIIGKTGDQKILVIIAEKDSTFENQLLWLFGLNEISNKFFIKDIQENDRELNFAGKYILKILGVEVEAENEDYLPLILDRFGTEFPSTSMFSEFARSLTKDISAVEEPDSTLLRWLEIEEMLFKTLEKYIVRQKLDEGFENVDDFISYSLSVQNRRKSRAGHSFENHLQNIFYSHGLLFSKGAKTERNNKPDFLFPGETYYRDLTFPDNNLKMLGVKTTAKDRWRQVLAEADRIYEKHLITLEPSISFNQTEEMRSQNLQLIVPFPLHYTYSNQQQNWLLSLSEFIDIVKANQNITNG